MPPQKKFLIHFSLSPERVLLTKNVFFAATCFCKHFKNQIYLSNLFPYVFSKKHEGNRLSCIKNKTQNIC